MESKFTMSGSNAPTSQNRMRRQCLLECKLSGNDRPNNTERKALKKHKKSDQKLKRIEKLFSLRHTRNRKSFVARGMQRPSRFMLMPIGRILIFLNSLVQWKPIRKPSKIGLPS